ncbi:MAG: 16S rRNA (guanine(527)-N(7))-methyltransferase RsmG [Chitinophagales bacterium]|nr:16S rRNA (guanine(527)-N(7))-methyltransferase RsmG [Chitinophagales bacterium]
MSIELIKKYFPELSTRQQAQFEMLTLLYQEWNQKINVISRKDMDAFMEKHVLHSLSIAKYIKFKKGWYIVDLGTGGGFPGIPLAILSPDVQFILIDSIGKKIKVVDAVKEALQLKNIKTIWGRVEESQVKANLVITRAVASLPDLIKWSQKVLKPQSKGIIALKGGDLSQELTGFKKKTQLTTLSEIFTEESFVNKYIVHYKP